MVSESAAEMAHSAEAESDARRGRRRTAAVVYFGISGFDQLMHRSNPGQMQSLLRCWVDLVGAVIAENGGEVDKILEGKVLAVFFAASDADKKSENRKSMSPELWRCIRPVIVVPRPKLRPPAEFTAVKSYRD